MHTSTPCKYPKLPWTLYTQHFINITKIMGSLHLNSYTLASQFTHSTTNTHNKFSTHHLTFSRARIRACTNTTAPEPPHVNFAFVHSVLLPDGTPDVHFRTAPGGQKLRDIMLDANIDLYGPYFKPLSNCAGGGTCATCMVEVIEGKELLNPRTDKEKEKLKRKPKNWRLACQTTVGNPDSTGLVVIQQLPEWKGHEWKYKKVPISELSQ